MEFDVGNDFLSLALHCCVFDLLVSPTLVPGDGVPLAVERDSEGSGDVVMNLLVIPETSC